MRVGASYMSAGLSILNRAAVPSGEWRLHIVLSLAVLITDDHSGVGQGPVAGDVRALVPE